MAGHEIENEMEDWRRRTKDGEKEEVKSYKRTPKLKVESPERWGGKVRRKRKVGSLTSRGVKV